MRVFNSMLWVCVCIICIIFAQPSSAGVEFQHKPADTRKIIIFVHGLWSDPSGAFGNWPQLISSDTERIRNQPSLSNFAVATVSYPATRRDALSVAQIASNLPIELRDSGILDDFDEIVFVAHSLGGIVMQEVLLNDSISSRFGLFLKTKAMFFLATPTSGAPAASFASALSQQFSGRLVVDLATISDNTYLQGLSEKWKALLSNSNRPVPFKTYCAYETRPYFLITVVPLQYAELKCDVGNVLAANEDHVSIAKPQSRAAQVYTWVRGQIADLGIEQGGRRHPPSRIQRCGEASIVVAAPQTDEGLAARREVELALRSAGVEVRATTASNRDPSHSVSIDVSIDKRNCDSCQGPPPALVRIELTADCAANSIAGLSIPTSACVEIPYRAGERETQETRSRIITAALQKLRANNTIRCP